MAASRRTGTSPTRAAILDGAQQLMVDSGYAAVTYRGVAARAGVTAGLVQYYFPALDDLFIAVLRQGTDRIVERLAETSTAAQPLRAIWAYASDRAGTALLMEYMALANHRKVIAPIIGEGGERVRQAQLAAITKAWDRYGLGETVPPEALLFLMSSLPRMIRLEESFGTTTGHAETIALVEQFLDRVEPQV
ncbi:MAG TPA: TetR/AcrR family transcriptional regulator [Acidimicrobiales bacterium]